MMQLMIQEPFLLDASTLEFDTKDMDELNQKDSFYNDQQDNNNPAEDIICKMLKQVADSKPTTFLNTKETPQQMPMVTKGEDEPFSLLQLTRPIDPRHGAINVTIKTQIQTNRRTNIYLDAAWPDALIGKKMPVYYYPPIAEAKHEQIRSIDDPSQLWLTEHFAGNEKTYLEVQFWMRTQEGRMQIIHRCNTHPSLLKLPGQDFDEKTVSHQEVKWTRNTVVFGVNFNCTRTCFKSELYMFLRVRCGDVFLESAITELPFRRSEKRKGEQADGVKCKRQHINGVAVPKAAKPKKKILVSSPPVIARDEPMTLIPNNPLSSDNDTSAHACSSACLLHHGIEEPDHIFIPALLKEETETSSLLEENDPSLLDLEVSEESSNDIYSPIQLAELINMENLTGMFVDSSWDPEKLMNV